MQVMAETCLNYIIWHKGINHEYGSSVGRGGIQIIPISPLEGIRCRRQSLTVEGGTVINMAILFTPPEPINIAVTVRNKIGES